MTSRTTIKSAIFAVLLLATFGVASDTPDFLIEMKIIDAGTEIATPRMKVREGEEASMRLSGQGTVAVGLIVNSANAQEAHVIAEVQAGDKRMSPELWVRKREWASVSVGELAFHVRVEPLSVDD